MGPAWTQGHGGKSPVRGRRRVFLLPQVSSALGSLWTSCSQGGNKDTWQNGEGTTQWGGGSWKASSMGRTLLTRAGRAGRLTPACPAPDHAGPGPGEPASLEQGEGYLGEEADTGHRDPAQSFKSICHSSINALLQFSSTLGMHTRTHLHACSHMHTCTEPNAEGKLPAWEAMCGWACQITPSAFEQEEVM